MERVTYIKLDDGTWGARIVGFPRPITRPGRKLQMQLPGGGLTEERIGRCVARLNQGKTAVVELLPRDDEVVWQ